MDQPLLAVKQISKRFPHAPSFRNVLGRSSLPPTPALENVSFQLARGHILCILGPNGAGKTTLLKILATLILPDSGSVRMKGIDAQRDAEMVKPFVGFSGDDMRSFYWRLTGRQNLDFFAALYGWKAYADTRYARRLTHLFQADFLEKRFDAYSSGMKKRLLLMRCLLHSPEIVLLDEPTKSLDYSAACAFKRFMKDELADKEQKTILLSTHQVEEFQGIADRFLILSGGRVLVYGSLDELREQTGFRGSSIGEIFTQLTHR